MHKNWVCPYCDQSSSRHWNLKSHIKRFHSGVGDPIKAEKDTANARPREKNLLPDPLSVILPTLRKYAEFCDLLKKLMPRYPIPMDTTLLWLALQSVLSPRTLQMDPNRKGDESPAGYRVQFCNYCLLRNYLEPVFSSSLELEAVTRSNHICGIETLSPANKAVPDNIIGAREELLASLSNVVNSRISQQQAPDRIRLKGFEFCGYKLLLALLERIGNKQRLPENKSWIEEEDYLDLGSINCPSNTSKLTGSTV